jgi:hypothetical protein
LALPEPKTSRDGTARTSVVLGALNILYGLGLILMQILPFMIIRLFPPRQPLGLHFSYFTLRFSFSIMFVIGGVGLISFQRWGRFVSGFAAIGTIGTSMVSLVMFSLRALQEPDVAQPLLGVFITAFLTAVLLIYPAVLLVLLGRIFLRVNLEK